LCSDGRIPCNSESGPIFLKHYAKLRGNGQLKSPYRKLKLNTLKDKKNNLADRKTAHNAPRVLENRETSNQSSLATTRLTCMALHKGEYPTRTPIAGCHTVSADTEIVEFTLQKFIKIRRKALQRRRRALDFLLSEALRGEGRAEFDTSRAERP